MKIIDRPRWQRGASWQILSIIQPEHSTPTRGECTQPRRWVHQICTPEAPLRVGGAIGPTSSPASALEVVFWSLFFVGSRWLNYSWVAHSSRNISIATATRPDPLACWIATPWSYPNHLYAGFDGGQALWQPHPVPHPPCVCEAVIVRPLCAAYPIYSNNLTPISITNWFCFAIKTNEKVKRALL